MKYLMLIGDGMADEPVAELAGRTPLEAAATPNMDALAAAGRLGRIATVPDGLPPGSDVANLSLLGYDAARYYRGRAPIEAASLGVTLAADETAFRCNLVALDGGLMQDYSAGHIDTPTAHAIIADLRAALDSADCRFFPGVSYRHLVLLRDVDDRAVSTTPPHDISGQAWAAHLPRGPGSERIATLMEAARPIVQRCAANRRRAAGGQTPASDIWLWGQGRAVALPTMRERYGLNGSVISAVDLVRGLGLLAGLSVRKVEGATGYLGTNYAGKVAAATAALAAEDFVYLHVEAPDETSHEGSLAKKLQAIEEFDARVVGPCLALRRQHPDLRIMVAPDHATPISTRTHAAGPVPFAVCGSGISPGGARAYSERSAAAQAVLSGEQFMDSFVRGSFA